MFPHLQVREVGVVVALVSWQVCRDYRAVRKSSGCVEGLSAHLRYRAGEVRLGTSLLSIFYFCWPQIGQPAVEISLMVGMENSYVRISIGQGKPQRNIIL